MTPAIDRYYALAYGYRYLELKSYTYASIFAFTRYALMPHHMRRHPCWHLYITMHVYRHVRVCVPCAHAR